MRYFIFLLILFSEVAYSQQKQSFYFDFNKSEFNEMEKQKINDWINEYPNMIVLRIEGFCDWVGNNDYNDKLSLKRIQSTLNYLNNRVNIEKDVEKKGFGKRFEQDKVQDLNRRVDIYFTYTIDDVEEQNQFIETTQKSNLDSIVKQSKVGEKIKLKNLYFYNNSGIFVPKSKPVLAELLKIMRENPNLKIEIHGHICCQPVTPNEQVSKIRALAVYNFLITNGIDKNRLNYKSFGSSLPIYKIPERNEEERNENRRVEILILEK